MESLTDAIRLRVLRLRSGVIDVLHGQIEFVFMAIRRTTILRAPIREDSVEGNLMVFKERQDVIVEQIGSRQWRLPVRELRESDLAI